MSEQAKAAMQAALPAYEIEDELGRGAFGVVYEARHTQLGRHVAIKQLPQIFAEDESVRERFIAEAQMVASLDHPHIVPVYDFVEAEGSRFLIMERCAGSVADRFKTEGIVTDEACAAVLACLAALDFAHGKGLLHRDIKPENLMYDTRGVIKLGDFGIARDLGADTRRTATGMIIGTPAYMSPEQCRGDDLTSASDVYSVAMMGYELLTGALPFPHTDSVNGLLAHHLVSEPAPLLQTRPELPGVVGEVIDRALSKDLSVRYPTAVEFATALARACVTAFGSGWLRRRRFVLHWPEIIAETERPAPDSPRTGTIMVRAGDAPHAAPAAPVAAQPAAAVAAAANATTAIEPAAATAAPAPPPALPAAEATQGANGGGPNWGLVGGLAAAAAAIVVGLILFTGGGSTTPDVDVSANVSRADATSIPAQEPTAVPPTTLPTQSVTAVPPAEATVAPAVPSSDGEPPLVLGSNGNPIMNRLPLDFDPTLADSPFAATPCPIEQELVACLFGAVVPDDESGELEAYWFSLGFTPELEPAAHHLHFYLPEAVDGDESRAGSETPGGSFRMWDGPWPATSFGGDNGRTLFTMADLRAAGATSLCVIVANAEHEAIPNSGNCAPVPATDDFEIFSMMANRLEGQWVGTCVDQALAIAPTDWRWYSMNDYTAAELAQEIRPTTTAEVTELLERFVASGGRIWAEGPVIDGFIVNFSMTVIPGSFGLSDSPDQVAATLAQLGVDVDGHLSRTVNGRELLHIAVDNEQEAVSNVFYIPDFDYVIRLNFTGPPSQEELADQVAYSATGC